MATCDEFGGLHSRTNMRIILSDFISLDGVVQAPGGPEEDTDGGFRHGGWSMPFFDPETMGPVIGEVMAQHRGVAVRAPDVGRHGRGLARPGRRPVRRPDERDPEVRRVADADVRGRRRRGGTTRRCWAATTPSARSAS